MTNAWEVASVQWREDLTSVMMPARGSMRAAGRAPAAAVVLVVVAALLGLPTAQAADDPCGTASNPVVCENSKPGDPPAEWDITEAGDSTIQGFATTMSVQPGETVRFKIKASSGYSVDVYRLGHYGGLGARRQAPRWTVSNPVSQPACASDPSTHLYDCGTWAVSTQWIVPSTAVSGVYVAKMSMGTDYSHITFVVRDDDNTSDVIFKTSDATWQAYNTYGGSSFYQAPSSLSGTQARAFKLSYNRPFATRGASLGRDFLFSNEYPTLKFLEANGIDVSYTTDVDVTSGSTVLTQHKAFLSVGHDEYWSLPERNRVEAARDAGVHLAFLSGNEAYWHAKYEASIDGTNTPSRTIVCYKDSWESSQLTPGAEATPTWRDPAYAAPHGSRPENALTGTAYMSNFTDLAVTVSAAQGKARLWRGTSLASLPPGGSAQLAPHSIGYESDEDIDNGHRPAGLMRLSETVGPTEQLVQNAAGTSVAPGTTTHSVTLYRAASGALVFGAGTINWGWGLDQYHDGDNSNPPDSRMQQATLNLLADMGSPPRTLQPGLVVPAASTDTQAPAVTVSSPSAGATLGNGTSITVSGTAADVGGEVVMNVEVSLDGGATYRRATGTTSWSHTGQLTGAGTSSIKVRASDDSANLGAPTSLPVTVTCPCSLFGAQVPTVGETADSSSVELGVKFQADVDGFVTGVRFYKGNGNDGSHLGTLWTSSGAALATGTFTSETSSGWQTMMFPTPVAITAGTTYVASYYAPQGRYSANSEFFTANDHRAVPLTARGRTSGVMNGVFANGHQFPSQAYKDTNYWVDVLYSRDDTTPPTIAATSPFAGAGSVASTVKPSATFVGTVDPASVTLTLADAAGNAVAGTVAFDAASRTVRFTPGAALTKGATYTATVNAISGAGTPMPAPHVWSFTTSLSDPLPGICPCTIWPDSAVPAQANSPDTGSVQVGVKFTSDVDGSATGVRFYKGPMNVGVHTGSIWTAAGGLLGSVTFTGETTSGWQTGYFTSPVDLTADTTYIVSYAAPNGAYAVTPDGLETAVDSGPLHALRRGGVYTYGSGAPLSTSSANYWVDLVFMASDAAPTVARTAPVDTSTNVNVDAAVTATLAGQVQNGTAKLVLQDASGATVDGLTTWTPTTRTIGLDPTGSLVAGATYTATVSGATALSGNLMSPYTWQFTTAGGECPCTLFSSLEVPSVVDGGDNGAVELGVGFSSSVGGQITGVRFYKAPTNTGTHVGNLWSASGALLASGTFTGESASGWQTLVFAAPVAVDPGTTYVASYFAPNGRYSATSQFFASGWTNGVLAAGTTNGRYRYGSASGFPTSTYGATNYWVDPIFRLGTPPDLTPPSVSTVTPVPGSTSQSVDVTPSASFSEPVDAASLVATLRTAAGATVPSSTTYDSSTRTATLTPSVPLLRGVTYTMSVQASDVAGNAMGVPRSWSFTTAQPDPDPGVCPCGLWTDATAPGILSDPDTVSIELGTAFTADVDGSITGVRFYKGPANTGTHAVSLWTADGTRLATATATAESTAGWQTADFGAPVPVTAGTAYLVSYVAPFGRYSATLNALSAPIDRAPLHTAAQAGRYTYGSGFPSTASATSYLVDPVFVTTTLPVDTTPPVMSNLNVGGSGTNRTISWTTDEASTSSVAYGTSATTLASTATGARGTSHSVTLTGLSSGATYWFRVTSADAAGNSATSPDDTASPATFTISDLVPPVVSAVAVDGSGTNRTISWTTDEASTSSVAYGTSATTLGSTATGASGTSHSVTLTGLSSGATYWFRVTSADAAGNSTTSPDDTASPATFTIGDLVAPVVSAVTASGSGTTATVTWTTDEASTSSVAYGTSATALTSTATGASGTSHSVDLAGLAPNTRYYFRVTSADAAGNSTTSPAPTSAAAVYQPTVAPISLTSAAQFATGTGGYVSDTAGGEVIATPAAGYELSGTALPSGLTSTALVSGGTTTVGSGSATLSGTQLATGNRSSGSSFAAVAGLAAGQSLGWLRTSGGASGVRAVLTLSSNGALSAVVNDANGNNRTIAIQGTFTGAPHEYRIDWASSTATFFVDGVQRASSGFVPSVGLRAAFVDPLLDASPLVVDWLRVGPYAASSTYVSSVIDAGATVGWDTLSRSVTAPAGTGVGIQVRSGATATPGTGWTGWTTVSEATGAITRSARYLQFRVVSTTSGARFTTPQTSGVTLAFHVL